MLRKLGAEVTVIELADQVLPGFDKEIVRFVARKMKKSGIRTILGGKAGAAREDGDGLIVSVETSKGPEEIACDKLVVTVGRKPYTEGLGLEAAGLATDERGFLQVDSQLRTSVPNIFAVGDVTGNPMLAHRATKQGEVVGEVLAGKNVACDYKTVPAVVFTDPEICLLYTSPSPRDLSTSRMPSSA